MPKLNRTFSPIGLACAAVILTSLYGCAPLVVGGVASTSALVATDRRTAGAQLDDQTIELKIGSDMRNRFGDKARINAMSYDGWVLLTGDIPTEQDKQEAETIAAKVQKVTKVINALRVGDITPVSVRTNDTWLTSKVKANLIDTKGVPSRTMDITTERGIVYLMGTVTSDEAQRAATAASRSEEHTSELTSLLRISYAVFCL